MISMPEKYLLLGMNQERPWWTAIRLGLKDRDSLSNLRWIARRVDGMYGPEWTTGNSNLGLEYVWNDVQVDREIEKLDRGYPLAVPEPAPTQVWFFAVPLHSGIKEVAITHITHIGETRLVMVGAYVLSDGPSTWPPKGGILVAGPGGPWFPPEEK